ncbi:amino acid ABC transporter permease [Microbacterium sp. SORGH_AS_0862]|uniref:amino acid ABC transporter permease n=1 Tax=Microbacterium sp. SORGH_AS_0862 TaxID=3041789 RepID=UPI002791C7A8|nr:amino acid ABC transporter permease [Microbacterium sp. SORGH_AS_0862]MDQ1205123.1 polar amino acid transport system permease protein [Microbacterium sp. SORGH_AS_0862]
MTTPPVRSPRAPVTDPATPTPPRVIRRRAVLPWIVAAALSALMIAVVTALATNPRLDWGVTGQWLFNPRILKGVWVTIQLSVLSMVFGVLLGTLIGIARLSHNRVLRLIASTYVTIFRSIPALLQLLLWGNIGLIVQQVSIGIPFTDVRFFALDTNDLIAPFTAAVIALALHEAAYVAEIVRGGVLGVDVGQREAGAALGMPPGYIMRRVLLPQAFRLIIPPLGNQFVTLIKATSLVAIIAGGDVLTEAQNIAASNYRVVEMLAVATFWYFLLVIAASICQSFLERVATKGVRR